MQKVIVLSGRVCAGKSTLAVLLSERASAMLVKSRELILERIHTSKPTRFNLQRLGQRLDRETKGAWLLEALSKRFVSDPFKGTIVLDAVRIPEQVQALRGMGWHVLHVHLEAGPETLAQRYKLRPPDGEFSSYEDLARNWTEKNVHKMRDVADVVVDTDRCCKEDVFARVYARVESRPLLASPLVDVLIGGQYGSEGKGNIAHYLAPEYDVLVRVGGPNAGHQVFRIGQEAYTFRQLPSGALGNPDATLVIGAGAVISLDVVLREIRDLSIAYQKLIIDPQAMIIDADDVKWEQETLKGAIGSTAQGIGKATARKILDRDPAKGLKLAKDIPDLNKYIKDTVEFFANCLSGRRKIMLEGTQGTSLSLHHGHYPHVTSRATTAPACLAEAGLSARHVRKIMMVCRTYPIRVGDSVDGKTSGFMSREIDFDVVAARAKLVAEDLHTAERGSVSKRPRRVGEFDWAQLRRSMLLNGPTDIALTFADYFDKANQKAFRFEQLTSETLRFIEEVEKVCGIPVSMISTAFSDRNIIDRRMW